MKMIKDNDVKYVELPFADHAAAGQHVTLDIAGD